MSREEQQTGLSAVIRLLQNIRLHRIFCRWRNRLPRSAQLPPSPRVPGFVRK
jgi:hypothetical protein